MKKMVVVCMAAVLWLQAVPAGASTEDLKWVGCGISRKAFMVPLVAAYERKTGVKIRVEGGGSIRGITEVAAGRADMGGTCRHLLLRDEERGVRLIPVGWDALVLIVHPSNKVDNLSLDQIRDIYTGKITNWKQVGGIDRKITVVARDGKMTGVGRMFRTLVFKNPEQEFAPSTRLVTESEGVERLIENEPSAIAVTGISSAQKRNVKMLKVNDKKPTRENIVKGSYLLYRPLYLVVKQQPSEAVSKFAEFARSEEGQAIIAAEGTVTLREGARLWGIYAQQMRDAGVAPGTF